MNKHDGCEGCKYEREAIESSHCIGCKQNAIDKYTRMTNSDKIRSMSDEELAEYICGIIDIGKDKFINGITIPNYDENSIYEWLQSEVDNGN